MDYRKIATLTSSPSLLGYGCMRFPIVDGKIDREKSIPLLKAASEAGVNYFDTAYIYHDGESESFLGDFLANHIGKPRDSYYIATKLPLWLIESLDDAKRIFAEQLQRLQTDYIDFYLLHDLKDERLVKMNALGVVDYCLQLQKEGKIRHFGFSTHDNLEGFKKTIAFRDWDFTMLHLNYMDMDNFPLYEAAVEKGIPVFAMEIVKGGSLSKLPPDIIGNFTAQNPAATVSSWAVRWVGSNPAIKVMLSGMSDMEQVRDNLATCSDFKPLNESEYAAIEKVRVALRKRVRNNCTGCNYCMPCPAGVNIPWCFSIWNSYGIYENKGHSAWEWSMVGGDSRPQNCTECGKCSEICPQHIDVVGDLKKAQGELDGLNG